MLIPILKLISAREVKHMPLLGKQPTVFTIVMLDYKKSCVCSCQFYLSGRFTVKSAIQNRSWQTQPHSFVYVCSAFGPYGPQSLKYCLVLYRRNVLTPDSLATLFSMVGTGTTLFSMVLLSTWNVANLNWDNSVIVEHVLHFKDSVASVSITF